MLVTSFFSVFGTQEQIRNGLPVKITVTHWDGEKMYEIALLPTRSLWHGSIAGKIWTPYGGYRTFLFRTTVELRIVGRRVLH